MFILFSEKDKSMELVSFAIIFFKCQTKFVKKNIRNIITGYLHKLRIHIILCFVLLHFQNFLQSIFLLYEH